MRIDEIESKEDLNEWAVDQIIHFVVSFCITSLLLFTSDLWPTCFTGLFVGVMWELFQLIKSRKLHWYDRSVDLVFWFGGGGLATGLWAFS